MVLRVSSGRKDFACFKKPIALETLDETVLTCSFQSKELSICKPRYLVFWTTSSSLSRIFNFKDSLLFFRALCFGFVEISMEWVFITLSESLLPFSHFSTCVRSSLMASFSWLISLDWWQRLVSSAYMDTFEFRRWSHKGRFCKTIASVALVHTSIQSD